MLLFCRRLCRTVLQGYRCSLALCYWLVFSGRLGALKNHFIAPEDSKVGEHTFVALVLTYNVLTGRKEKTLGLVTEDCNLFPRAWRSKFRELFNSGKIGFSFTVHTQVWPCMDVSTWVSWKCMWGVCVWDVGVGVWGVIGIVIYWRSRMYWKLILKQSYYFSQVS